MEASLEGKSYRSPRYKLVQFFERSRDGWKRKAQERKAQIKRFSGRLQKLRASRDRWKERAQALGGELAQVRQQLQELKNEG